jgi:hypothetical protein
MAVLRRELHQWLSAYELPRRSTRGRIWDDPSRNPAVGPVRQGEAEVAAGER